jgi:serine protease Do
MSLHRRLFLSLPLILGIPLEMLAQEPVVRVTPVSEANQREPMFTRTGVRRSAVVQAIERVRGAVVNIHSERSVAAGEGRTPNPTHGMGTGIIIDPRGYIVTNQHVIDDVSVLRCRLADGTTLNARVVARNNETDLALLKVDVATPLPTMPIGTAQDLMVGETVIAVGNAFGYHDTASVGIVSAINRDVSLNKDMSYKALIQTDACINPGNSGGPLVNINGELVGVNVAIRAGAQGIGFAIPVDHMIRSVSDMLRSRRRTLQDGMVVRDRIEVAGDGLIRNVVVERVDLNSPAKLAGIQPGDVLTQIGDVRVGCSFDVERGLLDRRSGEQIAVVVRRQEREQRLDLALGASDRMIRPAASSDVIWTKLGFQLTPLAGEQVGRLNNQLHGGLEVSALDLDGPAARAGIRKGDILVGLHRWETITTENVTYVLSHPELPTFSPLSFYILRAGQVRRGNFQQVN